MCFAVVLLFSAVMVGDSRASARAQLFLIVKAFFNASARCSFWRALSSWR